MSTVWDDSITTFEQHELQYSPLTDDRLQIRILTILPGHWIDDIECELTTESLDDPKLIYHGLSYAWGHHSDYSRITISGQKISITPSLEAALREVRQEDEILALWVDKLCINQNDEVEKGHQVGIMHQIFRRCSNVLIWLGPVEALVEAAEKHELLRRWSERSTTAADMVLSTFSGCCSSRRKKTSYEKLLCQGEQANDDPFAVVMHFAQDNHISELPCFFPNLFGQLYFKETPEFRTMWLRFRQLLDTSWHWRLWCVQEAVLANNAWVMYGSWRIPFSTIMKSVQNQRRHLYTCCAKVEKLFPETYAFCPDALYTQPPPTGDLDVLLRMYRYKACHDPRDKVYGISALLESGDRLTVDYTKSVKEVYTEAMSLIINNSRGDPRCLAGQGFSSNAHGLPSWVRNLELRPSIESVYAEMRRLEAYSLYNASASLTDGHPLTLQDDHIRASGIFIDSISQICTPLDIPLDQLDARYVLRVLLSWRRAAISADHDVSLLWPNLHNHDQFWRTITSDLIFQSETITFRRYTPADAEGYSRWLRQILLQSVLLFRPTLRDEFVQAMLCACFGRALFTTSTGNLGLCYPNARVGDEVWILQGGKVPFVLRAEGGKEDGYGLVGDCYLHGVMDGEVGGVVEEVVMY